MDLSIFLAKLFGIYFVIVGIVCIARKSTMREIIEGLKDNHILLILVALVEIAAGLAIALTHSIFSSDWRLAITIIGYWMVVEGILYMTMSKKSLRKFFNFFNNEGWYVGGGLISIALGVYLAFQGFGWA